MAYIFLDESGDLGFNLKKKGSSKYFVITLLFTQNRRAIEKIVKNTFLSLPKKVQQKHPGCLHAVKEKKATRIKLLQLLAKQEISIITITLNKKKVYTRLHDEGHLLYNYVTNILLDRIYSKKVIPVNSDIHLIASQRETNKFLNSNFKNYLESQVFSSHKYAISIEIKPSHSDKCLQAVDFACWAIFRSIEHEDQEYKKIIDTKIVQQSSLFP